MYSHNQNAVWLNTRKIVNPATIAPCTIATLFVQILSPTISCSHLNFKSLKKFSI